MLKVRKKEHFLYRVKKAFGALYSLEYFSVDSFSTIVSSKCTSFERKNRLLKYDFAFQFIQ